MAFKFNYLLIFSLIFGLGFPAIGLAQTCESIFAEQGQHTNIFLEKTSRQKALEIMMDGSLNVSRTKAIGRRFMAPADVADTQIAVLAEKNFKEAATYMLENFERLDISAATAIKFNRILTKGLVPEPNRGDMNYRLHGQYTNQIDPTIGVLPKDFYITWLKSPEAKKLYQSDPIAFAEVLHNTIISLDSFPDGNGRLSRLFADFALIKSGNAPAYYTSMQDYFDRGSARSPVSRDERKKYFHDIVSKGWKRLRQNLGRLFKTSESLQSAA